MSFPDTKDLGPVNVVPHGQHHRREINPISSGKLHFLEGDLSRMQASNGHHFGTVLDLEILDPLAGSNFTVVAPPLVLHNCNLRFLWFGLRMRVTEGGKANS